MSAILQLRQFKKVIDTRKNAKHPCFKEEEQVIGKLRELKEQQKIDDATFKRMVPTSDLHTQPARLYGLVKVHKAETSVRPVLSTPGSVYHPIANVVTDWLKVVPECQISTSTKEVEEEMLR